MLYERPLDKAVFFGIYAKMPSSNEDGISFIQL